MQSWQRVHDKEYAIMTSNHDKELIYVDWINILKPRVPNKLCLLSSSSHVCHTAKAQLSYGVAALVMHGSLGKAQIVGTDVPLGQLHHILRWLDLPWHPPQPSSQEVVGAQQKHMESNDIEVCPSDSSLEKW